MIKEDLGFDKYVDNLTGSLFKNEDDIVTKVFRQIQKYKYGRMNPSWWY